MSSTATITEEPTVAAPVTFTVPAGELARVLASVLPHASSDGCLPILGALQITVDGSTLTAAATDRYTIGTDTATGTATGDATFLLDRKGAADLVRLTKAAAKAYSVDVVLTFAADTLTATLPGQVLTFAPVEGTFPQWRRLFPECDSATGIEYRDVAVGAAHIVKFAKVVTNSKTTPLRFTFADQARKPVTVRVGDTFVGLIMPVTIAS